MSALDPQLSNIARFKICATLHAYGATEHTDGKQWSKEMRFSSLREATDLRDAALSKHLSALEEHGYVIRFREYGSTRAKDTVWVMLTAKGAAAFKEHWAALRELAEPTSNG